jgi:hypothetical protein
VNLNDFELGWLAGLLEGEGGFQYGGGSQTVRLEMSDEDIVLKAAALVYKLTNHQPTIRYQDRGNKKHSPTYIFSISGAVAQQVMRAIVPHMGFRRRQRIWQVLNKFAPDKTIKAADILKLVVRNG